MRMWRCGWVLVGVRLSIASSIPLTNPNLHHTDPTHMVLCVIPETHPRADTQKWRTARWPGAGAGVDGFVRCNLCGCGQAWRGGDAVEVVCAAGCCQLAAPAACCTLHAVRRGLISRNGTHRYTFTATRARNGHRPGAPSARLNPVLGSPRPTRTHTPLYSRPALPSVSVPTRTL